MSTPRGQRIPRTGRGTASPQEAGSTADWESVQAELRDGGALSWLSVTDAHVGVHTRPVFAAWDGSAFVVASNPSAVKTAHLRARPRVSVAIGLEALHLVVDAVAVRLLSGDDLQRASATLREVFDWPTEVTGDLLDAPYAAPTSGGPPFEAWALRPTLAHAFPTADQVEPTRFVFDGPT